MESGVEHSYLRNTRQDLLDRVDTLEVSRVVQRSQFYALDDHLFYLRGDEYGLVEFLTTMHYAVTYGIDLFEIFDATDLRIHELLQDQLNTYGMLRHRFLEFNLLAIRQFNQ